MLLFVKNGEAVILKQNRNFGAWRGLAACLEGAEEDTHAQNDPESHDPAELRPIQASPCRHLWKLGHFFVKSFLTHGKTQVKGC